jgi:DNA topoisomerase-1
MQTGIRPGSEADTGADKKAFGATTLQGQHVVTDADGNVRLKFVGKKGVSLDLPIPNRNLATMLQRRAKRAGPDGQLFPNVNAGGLLRYVHGIGGDFKTKDFRTLLGTKTALDEMKKFKLPRSMSAYKKQVREVAKAVASKLGNTPTVALQSYINPVVFSKWLATAS